MVDANAHKTCAMLLARMKVTAAGGSDSSSRLYEWVFSFNNYNLVP
jgi:hypothetical protein